MNTQILIKNKIEQDEFLNCLIKNFKENIYLVGGGVRDFLLEKETFDRDLIVLDEEASVFAKKISEYFCGTFVPLDIENKIYRVVMPDKKNFFDITNPIENSLEKDLKRRDLTINSIAVNLKTFEIVDYTSGIKDLSSKIIRSNGIKNLKEDPLRLLRVFRFYSSLGFEISQETLNNIKNLKDLVLSPAKERIIYEIIKMFDAKYTHEALLQMDNCGILEIIFPFVKEFKQIPSNSHHHLDLFHHSVETVFQAQKIYENSSNEVQEHLNRVDFGGFSRLAHLKLACFMHDIGKFSTWAIEPHTNRHRFIGHDIIGSELGKKYLKNMKFSNKQIDYITLIIQKHIYPASVVSSPDLNEKIMMRFVRKMKDNSIDNIVIAQADRLSALGPDITKDIVQTNINNLNNLLKFYLSVRKNLKELPKLLDGNEIITRFEISPSPELGKIMKSLHEAQLNGDVNTKEQAIAFVEERVKK